MLTYVFMRTLIIVHVTLDSNMKRILFAPVKLELGVHVAHVSTLFKISSDTHNKVI